MNPTPRAKVLEVYLENQSQGTFQLYVNGGIKVSKVKLNESFLKHVQNKTSMMVVGATYGFGYQEFVKTLERGLDKATPGQDLRIREKTLSLKVQKLLDQQYRIKFQNQIVE
jgi:hypothetical protein